MPMFSPCIIAPVRYSFAERTACVSGSPCAMNAAAANVPADGATLVRDAYAAATADQSGTYEQARSTCADNDATIRAYLGNDDAPRLSDSAAAE